MVIRMKKQILVIAGILYGLLGMKQPGIYAYAAQEVQIVPETDVVQSETEAASQNQIMVAEKDVDMKEAPDDNAPTVMTYEKGALIFTTGETADGWYMVIYQDKKGYVKKDFLSAQEMDVEGLDAEMEMNAQEGKLVMETVEKYRAEARRSKIWGSIIVILVAGIFAFGIFSAVKTKNDERPGKARKRSMEIEDWNA